MNELKKKLEIFQDPIKYDGLIPISDFSYMSLLRKDQHYLEWRKLSYSVVFFRLCLRFLLFARTIFITHLKEKKSSLFSLIFAKDLIWSSVTLVSSSWRSSRMWKKSLKNFEVRSSYALIIDVSSRPDRCYENREKPGKKIIPSREWSRFFFLFASISKISHGGLDQTNSIWSSLSSTYILTDVIGQTSIGSTLTCRYRLF